MQIELVTENNFNLFSISYSDAQVEGGHLFSDYYEKAELKHTYHEENYLITEKRSELETRVVGFFKIGKDHIHRRANIHGLYIEPRYRKKGISTEVAYFVAKRVFQGLGFNSISVTAWAENTIAVKTYDKFLPRVGVKKGYYYYNHAYSDQILWHLTFKESVFHSNPDITLNEFITKMKR